MEKIKQRKLYADWYTVAPGVWGMKDIFVNVYMIHNPEDNTWVLVDTGMKTTAPKIRKMAMHLFWPELRPSAIILTHGHFDHVGSLIELADEYDVPVYVHYMEKPYITGQSSYPPADPTVGGGMMSLLSWSYPTSPINLEGKIIALPDDGKIPVLKEWRFIHTPGHAPGHISLFREKDKVLIAGDAVVTTKAESAICTLMNLKPTLSGPPKYFTYNWKTAAESVRKLAALEPLVIASGHGRPMRGEEVQQTLHKLSKNFEDLAKPSHGRYVDEPAYVTETGVQSVPPPVSPVGMLLKVAGLAALAAATWWLVKQQRKKRAVRFSLN
ncbi:MAG TPA: MBL fold metallo-hydrolase [Chitinophagaceae bacterium]|nr:MBL fold metallo-hydrolase [Chitinophagaceae bacterium]